MNNKTCLKNQSAVQYEVKMLGSLNVLQCFHSAVTAFQVQYLILNVYSLMAEHRREKCEAHLKQSDLKQLVKCALYWILTVMFKEGVT